LLFKFCHAMYLSSTASNPCGNQNGNCDHMCIVTAGEGVGVLGYRCACNIGWMLGSDQRHCNRKLKKICDMQVYFSSE
jgi:hypothetical protein